MRIRLLIPVWLALACAGAPLSAETQLLRQPDVSDEHVVFAYAADLWVVGRDGGSARRLTSFQGVEGAPKLSPDGALVAFTGQYDGNTDVYVVPVEGGEPRRLTWHPGADLARGWTNDGRHVVFASGRTSAPVPYSKLWTISLDGGFPDPMPMPRAWRGQFSPDGKEFAYEPIQSWETEWRNYRGGQNKPIWVLDLADHSVQKLPWDGSNDHDPVYVDETIYFLSDRDYAVNVWAYHPDTRKLEQLTHFKDFDARSLEAGGGVLVFEQAGYIHLLDPDMQYERTIPITVRGDFPWARPHWEDVADRMTNGHLSPPGKRAVFEARGEIFTVPAEKGNVRNLTRSRAVADRAPAWSPDGQRICWFSDETGEYRLVIANQRGLERETIELENPTFYYTPAWSPDSKHISFGDADRNLWVTEVESGETKLIDNEGYAHPERTIYPEWSPDSKWIAYTKRLDNQYNAVWVYSLESGETHPITDGMSDSLSPAWDTGGKYLYFLASTDYGLNVGWLDMSSYQRPVTRAIYLAVLPADEPSPLLPESDEEEIEEETEDEDDAKEAGEEGEAGDDENEPPQDREQEVDGDAEGDAEDNTEDAQKEDGEQDEDKDEEIEVRIDFDGLDQRIVALNVDAANFVVLLAGTEGTLLYAEAIEGKPGFQLHRYTLEDRESKPLMSGLTSATLSADGKKLLYGTSDDQWGIVDAGGEPKPGDGALDTSDVRAKVDPRLEWKQMFREAWRYQRDYFYVENVHGLDLDEVYDKYAPWVDHVRHRSDLSHVLDILGGETAVGHSFTWGGDNPDVETVPVGLLGADLEVHDGRYRIARIYTGENWNPDLQAPLSGPGIDAHEGDYLLAVNGVELDATVNPYSLFEETAGKQIVLRLNAEPDPEGAREVVVVPVASEGALRRRDWVESNRRRVDEMSGGRLAYIWLPNTGQGGYTYFNRYYFAQQDKAGAVIDERFNGGGSAADYMIDLMARPLMGYFNNPVGAKKPFTNPNAGIWGPKVMIINDAAGSGGDLLPYMFRQRKIGPLIGTRTWGGLVGIWDVPPLVDGGYITAPRGGFFDLEGKWAVENEGVAPDIEVEQLPALVLAGHDPQLEKAVEVALELLERHPVELKSQPPDPVRVKRPE
ncbi:MAG: PDZ domain-containing protein [Planctomycetes bacterium]|nr:PDZ domain-containing protein [Planctomycetota bacterium]